MADDEDSEARFERKKAEYKTKYGVSWDDTTRFYGAVGQGISFWAVMETRLVQICAKLLGASDERTGVLMYSIMSFQTWLNIIDDLFLMTPSYEKQKKAWGKTSARLRAIADTRNRLAHHTVFGSGKPELKLRPGSLDTRSKTRAHEPLTEVEIMDFTGEVSNIHDKLDELWLSLPPELPKTISPLAEAFRKISPAPIPDPPHGEGSR